MGRWQTEPGIQIGSATCDGAPNILRVVREVCLDAILQRRTAHIALEIKTWLTSKPQTPAAQELLALVGLLVPDETPDQAQLWIRAFVKRYLFFKSNVDKIKKN